jgi:prepilin-type N-terminal cleavage/methylation domain-containing protein
MKKIFKKYFGFSLIEMAITIVIVGIVAGFGAALMQWAANISVKQYEFSNVEDQARLAMTRLTREMRAIQSNAAGDLNIGVADEISFAELDGSSIRYFLSGSDLMRSVGGGAAYPLAQHVTSFGLTYFDQNGAATTTGTGVRYIQLILGLTENDTVSSLRTTIFPRNF